MVARAPRAPRAARVVAQGKVNLLLRVGGADETGYHQIATIFQRIDLADEVVVRVDAGPTRSVTAAGPALPAGGLGAPEGNLAYRAAVAYAERAGWVRGFAIELTKHIPVGGGLGGGSADAAAVLRALDAIADRPLGPATLWEISCTLGADVPFLASDLVVALAGGRGERLKGADALPTRDVLLAVPPFGVTTGEAYRWLDEARADSSTASMADLQAEGDWGWAFVERHSANDFEPIVERRYPELRAVREQLGSLGAKIARLSGSGAVVFGIFEGAPARSSAIGSGGRIVSTRTSSRVVQVEVLE